MQEVKLLIAKDFLSKIESNIKGLTDIIDSAEKEQVMIKSINNFKDCQLEGLYYIINRVGVSKGNSDKCSSSCPYHHNYENNYGRYDEMCTLLGRDIFNYRRHNLCKELTGECNNEN